MDECVGDPFFVLALSFNVDFWDDEASLELVIAPELRVSDEVTLMLEAFDEDDRREEATGVLERLVNDTEDETALGP